MSVLTLHTPERVAPQPQPAGRVLTGRGLVQCIEHHGPSAMMQLADDLVAGNVSLARPTLKQALALTGLSEQRYRELQKWSARVARAARQHPVTLA